MSCTPVLCPACDEHLRGYGESAAWTLNSCSHVLCGACVNAVLLSATPDALAVCPVCAVPTTQQHAAINRTLADYAEIVYRANGGALDDDLDTAYVPPPTPEPLDAAAQAKADALKQRCLYAAHKMEAARDRAIAARDRLQARLADSLAIFDAQVERLRAKIIAHRDATIAEAQRIVSERTAILEAQTAEQERLASLKVQAEAGGDKDAVEALSQSLHALATQPRAEPLVEIVSKAQPVIDAITAAMRVSDGVDATITSVTGDIELFDAAAGKTNAIVIDVRDAAGLTLDMLEPVDVYVDASSPDATPQQVDEAVTISVQAGARAGSFVITYNVNPAAGLTLLQLRIDVCGVALTGSPFNIRARIV